MAHDDNTLPLDGKGVAQPERAYVERATRYLKERGIPRVFAAVCGIAVQRPARRNGFNGAATSDKKRAGAIMIPYFNHDGTRRDHARYRLADEVRKGLGLDQKFDQDQNTGAHLYMPPLKHPKGLTMQQVFDDTSIPLNIAEGETRALAANYLGEPTVAIGGINMGVVGGELLKDLQDVRMQGRIVRLLIDADVPRHEKKQNGIIQLTRELEERGADMYLMPAPGDDKEGWDDFIAANGAKAFRKQLAEAKSSKHPDFASWGYDGIDLRLNFAPVPIAWLTETPRPIDWTVEGLLPRRAVGLLIAQGGTGKTFLAQGLAQSVASGSPFLGHPVRKGKAVHIVCEEGSDELRRRAHRIYRHEVASMDAARVERFTHSLTENLIPHSAVGQQVHLVTTDGNNVLQGRALSVLIHQLNTMAGVELLVLDPLSRLHNVPEESQTWGTAIINACERIAQEVDCAVLVVHHTGKNSEREDAYASRGASALADAARVALLLKYADAADCRGIANVSDEEASSGRILRLINAKLSHGPRQSDVWLRRTEGGVLEHFDPELRRTAFADDNNIKLLRDWWQTTHERKPIFERTVKNRYEEIFNGTLTRRPALDVFARAFQQGQLVLATNEKANGRGYVFKGGDTP